VCAKWPDVRAFDRDACIVDHDINSFVALNTGPNSHVHFSSFGNIGAVIVRISPSLANLLVRSLADDTDIEVIRFACGCVDRIAGRWIKINAENLTLSIVSVRWPSRSLGTHVGPKRTVATGAKTPGRYSRGEPLGDGRGTCLGAFFGECLRNGRSETGRSACDDGYATLQPTLRSFKIWHAALNVAISAR
jgi:hypothetical protein